MATIAIHTPAQPEAIPLHPGSTAAWHLPQLSTPRQRTVGPGARVEHTKVEVHAAERGGMSLDVCRQLCTLLRQAGWLPSGR